MVRYNSCEPLMVNNVLVRCMFACYDIDTWDYMFMKIKGFPREDMWNLPVCVHRKTHIKM